MSDGWFDDTDVSEMLGEGELQSSTAGAVCDVMFIGIEDASTSFESFPVIAKSRD